MSGKLADKVIERAQAQAQAKAKAAQMSAHAGIRVGQQRGQDAQRAGRAHWCTLGAARLPSEREQFAPWDGPAALMPPLPG